jgi:hypothetical protein
MMVARKSAPKLQGSLGMGQRQTKAIAMTKAKAAKPGALKRHDAARRGAFTRKFNAAQHPRDVVGKFR